MPDSLYPEIVAGPPKPSVIIQPQALSLPVGSERYVVQGAGAILISVRAGDHLTFTNDEGAQPCEIIAADEQGRIDAGLVGAAANGDGAGLRALLTSDDQSLRALRLGLERRSIDLSKTSGAIHIFGEGSPAGDCTEFQMQGDGVVIIAAPSGMSGEVMDLTRQNTATPITVMRRRTTITQAGTQEAPRFELPDPLAEPIDDLRVLTRTARSFFVKKGDFIQIIDVEGRQCSDFQCFSARKLDKGVEHALDVTTTRALIKRDYPMPGLHAKYYDQDMLPLLEVIQDTCGRHDAFALACAAKHYDDIGYPGHVNCSDNFNAALDEHGVTARAGWMAINFFFNTRIDAHGILFSDEPWSRPGDYVMVRALTDLICVSSACPDDTSPANGWNPTDIHVRTYKSSEDFKRAVAIRATPDAEPKMTKETGFHASFAEYTRDFVDHNGFWQANSFPSVGGVIDEYHACRERCIILDLSALRKFEITGPDAEALCQYIFTRNVKKMADGQVAYTAMCYPHGGMIDDGTLFRLARNNFRWIGGADYGGEWIREQARELGLKVLIRSSTDMQHNVAVQGPESRDLLAKILWTLPEHPTLAELQWFRFTPARIGDHQGVPVVVSRTGYTGELGYEIFCHPKHAKQVFDAIWAAGQDHGLKPMGLAALDMLRIEAGLIFANYEFSDQTDPFEAGIGFTVPLKSKEDDFIGREALIRRKANPTRKLVGLDIDSAVDVAHGDCLHIGRAQIGEVTSSVRSPILGKNIALARVDIHHADIGTKIEIGKLDGQQKRLPATIVGLAHYDPKKTKPQS